MFGLDTWIYQQLSLNPLKTDELAAKQPSATNWFPVNPIRFRWLLPVQEDTVADRQTDRKTENADTLETKWTHGRKKNSRHRSLQNVSSCFRPDPGMEIAALYKAELI